MVEDERLEICCPSDKECLNNYAFNNLNFKMHTRMVGNYEILFQSQLELSPYHTQYPNFTIVCHISYKMVLYNKMQYYPKFKTG
jgi:hypothetical protein